jgi:hypothetical protein
MNNDPGKYLRLFVTILLSVVGFIVALVLLFLLIRLFFGILSYIPWMAYVYILMILSVPAAIFVTAFIVFFKRTAIHPVKFVRLLSYTLFIAFLICWGIAYVWDMITFFRTGSTQIMTYKSWDLIFLTANVTCIFFIGVVQALTAVKEVDWMERKKSGDRA